MIMRMYGGARLRTLVYPMHTIGVCMQYALRHTRRWFVYYNTQHLPLYTLHLLLTAKCTYVL